MMGAMQDLWDQISMLIQRGGYVMIPLLAMSVIAVTLILERCWFWVRASSSRQANRIARLGSALRRGERATAAKIAADDGSPYGRVATALLEHGVNESVALEAVENQRPRIERFMIALSTIITAAPLLGILGTVIGIIQSFDLLGSQATLTDPRVVSQGIAEALLTTALGLIVALVTLFPYMAFRKQVDRMMGRLESLIAAAEQGRGARGKAGADGAPAESRTQQMARGGDDAESTSSRTAREPAGTSTR